MARGACNFRQSDLTKALKAAKAAGLPVMRIEIEPSGKIVVLPGLAGEAPTPKDETSEDVRSLL